MICYLKDPNRFIDLSDPKPRKLYYSTYPFGFTVLSLTEDWSNCEPDRCEYLLARLVDPQPLQDFLVDWRNTYPELCI